jgi:thiamine biosynthesis lipoprotein
MLVHCRRPAMATWFEVWLCGNDAEHLSAVGEAALDEVARVERLLSRFDPTSEVARVNREAAQRPVLMDRELFAILADCRLQFERTAGYFDVRLGGCPRPFVETVLLDETARTVRFGDPSIALDFGGYGKGYALDQAARILQEFGVVSALMHGGTSSVLARGAAEDGRPWRVGLRDPFAEAAEREVAQLALSDCGLSSSAVFHHGASESDILDPTRGRRLSEPAGCSVIAPTALDAEILSTALLAMGRERATAFVRERLSAAYRVAWIEPAADGAELRWLGEG